MCSGSIITSTPATFLLRNTCKLADFDFLSFLHDLMNFSCVVKEFSSRDESY